MTYQEKSQLLLTTLGSSDRDAQAALVERLERDDAFWSNLTEEQRVDLDVVYGDLASAMMLPERKQQPLVAAAD